MALIGSGAKTLPNVVLAGTWQSADIDQALSAFAEQLGGIYWLSGSPFILPGNLDQTNFVTDMALGSEYLAQRNSNVILNSTTYYISSVADGATPAKQYIVCPHPMAIRVACLCISGFSAGFDLSGSVTVAINGRDVAVFYPNGTTTAAHPVTTSSILAQSKTVGVYVEAGDIITVDSSALSESGNADYSVVASIVGTVENRA